MDDAITEVVKPQRCVIVVDAELPAGKAANAAAVVALTIGQRHPHLVGEALVDASGVAHPGLIPIGITVLSAGQDELSRVRALGVEAGCDVVTFPVQGQQTTDYEAFREAVAGVETPGLNYVGIALVGARKPLSKIVGRLGLLR